VEVWQLSLALLVYVGLLFVIAWRTERNVSKPTGAWVYTLSLAVYCTSWTYYGAVGRAATSGWDYLPIYLGPALFILFGHRFLKRLIRVSKQHNITSIADFIAARYGKSQSMAVTVTCIATIGTVPYVALQLKAMAVGYQALTGSDRFVSQQLNVSIDSALIIAAVMAFFAIIFGTRHVDSSEHHRGMVAAIAFESVVKLLAFAAVGLFCFWGLTQGDFVAVSKAQTNLPDQLSRIDINANFITQTLLATLAMFCLPRQFHMGVVENTDESHVDTARWLLPVYLGIISLFVAPIAISGMTTSLPNVNPDTFVLSMPLAYGPDWLTVFAMIGGFSAATGMIIVSTVALSTMISNDIVVPLLLRSSPRRQFFLSSRLIAVRRTCIALLMVAAYAYYRTLAQNESLASIGLLAFAAAAQFAPGVLFGLSTRSVTGKAVLSGMLAGTAIWAYTLLFPVLVYGGYIQIDFDAHLPQLLHPQALLGVKGLDPLSHGVLWSLGVNVALVWLVSQMSSRGVLERLQAQTFTDNRVDPNESLGQLEGQILVNDLEALVNQFWDEGQPPPRLTAELSASERRGNSRADSALLIAAEADMASAIGNASARVLLRSALSGRDVEIADIASAVGEAAQALDFSRDVLQSTLDNIEQAVSVIDADLRLVAWNQQYQRLFDYPEGMLQVGLPAADLISHNTQRGECGPGDVETHVSKRLAHYQKSKAHSFERTRNSGQVLQMRGNPIPGGGFVTSFTDITDYKNAMTALENANATLEQRVSARTQTAESAQQEAERANLSKTRFLAAASHDLLQPLHAARLFATASMGDAEEPIIQSNMLKIAQSLSSAESLLGTLLDISKLDTGRWPVRLEPCSIGKLFQSLENEFGVIAADKGVKLRVVACRAVVKTDPQLLRQAVQNLLGNAIRYTDRGTVLLGIRRSAGRWRIEVWDTGPGIDQQNLGHIFEEFQRFHSKSGEGLGLGLSIVERICRLTDFKVEVKSQLGKGSCFSLSVPISDSVLPEQQVFSTDTEQNVASGGKTVLCIDNHADVLAGMKAMLEKWGYVVQIATNREEALRCEPTDCVLADFQLDGETGLEVLSSLAEVWENLPVVAVITANHDSDVRELVAQAGYRLIYKPLRPASLRAWLNASCR
jgi:Na+/proline symporter/signal transduction histidine kinase